jgi:hypothetical protein
MHVSTVLGNVTTDIDRFNVLSIVALCATRFSELSSPEGFCSIDFETEGFEVNRHRRRHICGDDDIVTVDINSAGYSENIPRGRSVTGLS